MENGRYFITLVALTFAMLGGMSFVSVCLMLALWDGSTLSNPVNTVLSIVVLIGANAPIAAAWTLLFMRVTRTWDERSNG